VSRAEVPPSQGPLISQAAGCLVWWPLAAMVYLVIFPGDVGVGIAVTGVGLLALRLTRLTWAVTGSTEVVQRLRRAAFSRRAAARSPSAARTALS
jgi:hypothetical protein